MLFIKIRYASIRSLDKLKYLNLTESKYKKIDFLPQINIDFSEKENTKQIGELLYTKYFFLFLGKIKQGLNVYHLP